MSDQEIIREPIDDLPGREELEARAAEGWRPVAVEWRRDRPDAGEERHGGSLEPPYGLSLRPEGARLEPNPGEEQALRLMLRMVIDDRNSLGDVARVLNDRELTTRDGRPWRPTDVFHLLPRLVEVAPGIYRSSSWTRDSG